MVIRNVTWAPNQHIRMISEGSCDTEDWSNGCWKFSFAITGINYILKDVQVENSYFKILILFYNITVFSLFLIN